MSLARTLHALQTVEVTLEAKAQRLREIQAALGETQELRSARAALEEVEAEHRRWQGRQRDLEFEIQELERRIADSESELMSGQIRNPRELEKRQANVESLRRRREELEDALLEAMVAVEELAARREEARAALDRVETHWREDQERLQAEQTAIRGEITRLRAEREGLLQRLSPEALAEYQRLRQRRGYAVSEVQQGVCQVCGVTLPTSLVQAARRDEELVYCSSCGRILCSLD